MQPPMNELLVALLVGVLLSISAGVRMTIPLLVVSALAYEHVVTLPSNLAWMGGQTTVILLSAAFVIETVVHFIPAAGTALRAAATPLSFVAGTLLMAIPLGDRNPLMDWIIAGCVGGGAAALTHLGTTGARAATGPANLATGGAFGIGWNIIELAASAAFLGLGALCVKAGWPVCLAVAILLVVAGALTMKFIFHGLSRIWARMRSPFALSGTES